MPKNLKTGDYINIVDEKSENANITQAKELLEITESTEKKNIVKFQLLNESVELKLNGNIRNPQIKNFITWLGKFIKNLKYINTEITKNVIKKTTITSNNTNIFPEKSINNFIKTFIKEISKSIIENKSLKIPDPKSSAKIINKIIKNINDDKDLNNNIKQSKEIDFNNIENDKKIKNNTIKEKDLFHDTDKNISKKIFKKFNNELSLSNEKKGFTEKKENIKNNIENKKITDTKELQKNQFLHKAINAYKTFSQFEIIQEPNFIFLQIFGMPLFLNIEDEIEYKENKQKKIKRIAFSFLSKNFGLINSIIYKKENNVSLNFFIENNIEIFKTNINWLINNIQKDGIKIDGLQINPLEKIFELNKKGLYG
ncbi:hypothetical protein [Marinitoga aeolica]|uniref:Flagellar hook-length control protein-like C-terminal domain-containing protein n=1 Tax=Marinitoga aeolica TaxID=2809031 RepID=A0ABY8PT67_9BACT|nr:hypothetical protein [Marinitoga aeolica]WGS65807.1 hypothetical protein JRV97_04465 [Marinitoga aeolica]